MTATNNDAAVPAALDLWAKATRAMDIDAIMACYARNVVSYDCHSAFQFRDAAAHRKHLEMCFPYMQGPITFDVHELSIASQDDLAFCHFTAHCGCKGHDGNEHWSWLRFTSCLRKIDGKWLIVHDHCSAPFDPMSGKAMLDAGPEELKRGRAA
jgi:ketosteroid isomerase-like protein